MLPNVTAMSCDGGVHSVHLNRKIIWSGIRDGVKVIERVRKQREMAFSSFDAHVQPWVRDRINNPLSEDIKFTALW